jgi:hypothetical protein
MKKSNNWLKPTLLTIAALAIAYSVYFYWKNFAIHPQTNLGEFSLNMSEVEITLAYGGKPECPGEITENGKVMVFDYFANKCATKVYLYKETGGSLETYRICSDFLRPKEIVEMGDGEVEIIAKLGKPSHISISESGLKKISTFQKYNVAFTFNRARIEESCVTKEFPVRYTREYKGS